MPTALITGVTGQDGWYLALQLIGEGWQVHGVARRAREVPPGTVLHMADVANATSFAELVAQVAPDVIFHLAADSWAGGADAAAAVVEAQRTAMASVLTAWRTHAPASRVVVASSSEVFGRTTTSPQDASTPLDPATPYGHGKAVALELLRRKRAETGGHLSAAILYNHESERRDPRFLGRKVSLGVAAIVAGRAAELHLGNLDAMRDWGYAPDHVDALVRMANAATPGDYVIGTGLTHSVLEFCEHAFAVAGLAARDYVRSDPHLVRAVDPATLVANVEPAARELGWRATTTFPEMVGRLVRADLARMEGA
ncbi:MAG: GDP-mannose 4,6-dehydratase [Gemmatimonadetes bacterium]|nr:GDP-mannose 4,6-dehydratase [Gemmatimonadota bacterium]